MENSNGVNAVAYAIGIPLVGQADPYSLCVCDTLDNALAVASSLLREGCAGPNVVTITRRVVLPEQRY